MGGFVLFSHMSHSEVPIPNSSHHLYIMPSIFRPSSPHYPPPHTLSALLVSISNFGRLAKEYVASKAAEKG
jgi:hypothetical protein